jgi:hypothetical protein
MEYEILRNRSFIEIKGADATKFLQGITTNQVTAEFPTYHLILSPQGRYLCDFILVPIDDKSYILDLLESSKERLLQMLGLYKMRSKVEINECSSQYLSIYSTGSIAEMSFKDPRSKYLQYRSIIKTDQQHLLQNFATKYGLYNTDKYRFTIPEGDIDMISEKALPPEYGVDLLNGISYSKGCYVGQEVIARTKYQGIVRKKVYHAEAETDISDIKHGTEITFEDVKIGIFCSGYGLEGIILIREQEDSVFNIGMVNQLKLKIKPAIWYK